MPKRTLNDRIIQSLKVTGKTKDGEPRTRIDMMDALVPGLAIRVTEKGQKTFVLVARFAGASNPTRRSLGEYGELGLAEARTKARKWLELIQAGKDPAAEVERAKREELRKQKHSFAAVAEEFIKRHVSKTRKAAVAEREIRREFIDRWGPRPIADIDQFDVKAVLREAVDRGAPYQAHNLLVHIRSLFNWACAQGDYGLDHSPCDRLKPKMVIGKKAVRTRVLKDNELRLIWDAADAMGYPYGPLFRMLMLTGQRKSEVAEARWSEIDLTSKLWTIPAERMKADAAHVVPLTQDVIDLLEELPRFHGDSLFSTTFGAKAVNGFSKAKLRIDGLIPTELEPWRIHDIRRTMRTGLSALPIPDKVRELVIAHTLPGLHKVYDQFSYVDEKRNALELWSARLRAIVTPPPPSMRAGKCHLAVVP